MRAVVNGMQRRVAGRAFHGKNDPVELVREVRARAPVPVHRRFDAQLGRAEVHGRERFDARVLTACPRRNRPAPQGPRPDADLQRKEALRLYRDVIRSARHFTWKVALPRPRSPAPALALAPRTLPPNRASQISVAGLRLLRAPGEGAPCVHAASSGSSAVPHLWTRCPVLP
jgi:hypothetical protein